MYEKVVWPLDDKFETAYKGFILSLEKPEKVFGGLDIP